MSNLLPILPSHYTTRQSPLPQPASLARPASASSTATTLRPPSSAASSSQAQDAAMNGNPGQASGLRYPSNKKSIYDRNLNRSKNAELSRAAFAYLFIEMIAYAQKGAKDVGDLEQRYATIDVRG